MSSLFLTRPGSAPRPPPPPHTSASALAEAEPHGVAMPPNLQVGASSHRDHVTLCRQAGFLRQAAPPPPQLSVSSCSIKYASPWQLFCNVGPCASAVVLVPALVSAAASSPRKGLRLTAAAFSPLSSPEIRAGSPPTTPRTPRPPQQLHSDISD